MNADDLHKQRIAIQGISQGKYKPAEIARLLAVNRATVIRWMQIAGINHARARAAYVARQWEIDLTAATPKAISRRAIKRKLADHATAEYQAAGKRITKVKPQMFTSQARALHGENPQKRDVLANLKKGKITIPQAAKRADVPISGIVGWMRLAGLEIPDEYNQPRRRPREK